MSNKCKQLNCFENENLTLLFQKLQPKKISAPTKYTNNNCHCKASEKRQENKSKVPLVQRVQTHLN